MNKITITLDIKAYTMLKEILTSTYHDSAESLISRLINEEHSKIKRKMRLF